MAVKKQLKASIKLKPARSLTVPPTGCELYRTRSPMKALRILERFNAATHRVVQMEAVPEDGIYKIVLKGSLDEKRRPHYEAIIVALAALHRIAKREQKAATAKPTKPKKSKVS